MQDQNGIYYYPDPSDASTRVYVRRETAGIQFRLWRAGMPEVWEKHGWVDQSFIESAAALYRGQGEHKANPMLLYDVNVARALLNSKK